MMTRRIHFTKYHGAGNDYIYIDLSPADHHFLVPHVRSHSDWIKRFIRKICRQRFGVGGDGVIFIGPPVDDTDSEMIMHNLDGSRSSMCGNGLRCVAAYTFEYILQCSRRHLRIMTACGVRHCEIITEESDDVDNGADDMCNGVGMEQRFVVAANLGTAMFAAQSIPTLYECETLQQGRRAFMDHTLVKCIRKRLQQRRVDFVADDALPLLTGIVDLHKAYKRDVDNIDLKHCDLVRYIPYATLSMGNPQCVVFVNNVDEFNVSTIGSLMEGHLALWPDRTNVMFVQMCAEGSGDDGILTFKTRPFERGSGETLACGSGACAVGVVVCQLGLVENKVHHTYMDVRVQMPGGTLIVRYDPISHDVILVGEAVKVFDGAINCSFS